MHRESKLLDMDELGKRHPALKNRYRIQWLIRTRQIPIVKIGRRIFFDEKEIGEWIENQKVPAHVGKF